MLRLQYYKETGQSDEAKSYETYLRETGQFRAPANMAKIRERQNANERDMAEAETPSYGTQVLGGIAALAHGIPGAEALQATIRSKVRGQSYREAYQDIHGAAEDNPGSTVASIAGSGPLAAVLPGSPALAGAAVGAAGQALDANPDQSLLERAGKTAIGAAVGGALGKGADMAVTWARSIRAPQAATDIIKRIADRKKEATALYDKAIAEGVGKTPTTAVKKFLNQPDIAEIVQGLQSLRPFQKTQPTDPKMLDGIYKVLSDREKTILKGLAQTEPGKPNLGRFAGEDIAMAKEGLLTALETPETHQIPVSVVSNGSNVPALAGQSANGFSASMQLPAMMPNYRGAVQDFAKRSKDIAAVQRGVDALRVGQRTTLPAGKQLHRVTPEAFAEWAKTASPSEIAAAREGVLGAVKKFPKIKVGKVLGTPVLPKPSRSLQTAPGLLRSLDPHDAGSELAKYGLLFTNALAQ